MSTSSRLDMLMLHLLLFVVYLISLIYNLLYVGDEPAPYLSVLNYKGFGGKFKFLTFWNLIIQTVFFGLATYNDVKQASRNGRDGKKTGLQKFLDTSLASVVYPVGTFVVMTFWGIYMVDRELVYPKRLDKIIPQWLNHVMHTTVFPILLMEKYLVYHEYPSRKKGMTIMMAFALAYLIWILWVAYYADIWVYPILQVMEAHQRALFIAILMGFFCSIYILGESVNKFLWRKSLQPRNPKPRTKKIS